MSASQNGIGDFHAGDNTPSPVSRVIAFGFYDGPTDGVLQLGTNGPVYRYDLAHAEDHSPDTRRFLLRRLPNDALTRIIELLAPYHSPQWPCWCPIWKFPSNEIQIDVEEKLDRLMTTANDVEWELETPDWYQFQSVTAYTPRLAVA